MNLFDDLNDKQKVPTLTAGIPTFLKKTSERIYDEYV